MTEGKSDRVQYISPEDIVSIQTTAENLEILNDWLYWPNGDIVLGFQSPTMRQYSEYATA
jgi:hypothetical protein